MTLLVLCCLVTCLLLWSSSRELTAAHENERQSLSLCAELRKSSDELTRLARTFVVTGEADYERAYWRVLDVRDGKAARTDGRQASLRALMVEAGFTATELDLLNQAEANSNALVATETAAFQAMLGRFMPASTALSRDPAAYTRVAEVDQAYAVRIMHDERYHADKARIMKPIDEAVDRVAQRTRASVSQVAARNQTLVAVSVVLVGVLVMLIAINHLLVQRPVVAALAAVASELRALAAGSFDLSRRIGSGRKDEIGDLVRSLDEALESVQSLTGEVAAASSEVAGDARRIAESMLGLQEDVAGQATSSNEIAASSRSIADSARELGARGADVAAGIEEAAQQASSSRAALESMLGEMQALETASRAMTARFSVINEHTQSIAGVVEAITRIAGQTNLLSLNAEIEAEKAGDAGQGFSVVAREVRRLADQTARSASDVARNVNEMRVSVEVGVTTLDALTQKLRVVNEVVDEVYSSMAAIGDRVLAIAPKVEEFERDARTQDVAAEQIGGALSQFEAVAQRTETALGKSKQAVASLETTAARLGELVRKLGAG